KMSQPIQPDPIKPPSSNELNNLFDTLLDENIHIDGLNNQATQLQAQIQGDAQIIIQLQTQLATANNNFDLLNHAHNFQTGQLQI
ncbi:12334_t:CDS:2, partial [Entrophospora sp. SA101]